MGQDRPIVRGLHLLPAFGNWTLAELSAAPAVVRDFHRDVTKSAGPIAANQCARILRAVYKKNAKKLDRSLPAELPTSAVVPNHEYRSQKGIAFADFPKWKAALDQIDSPISRGYFLFCLLTGTRSGEAARIRLRDVDCKSRTVTIPNAKAGNEITIPMSWPIAKALRMARGRHEELVFPGCRWVQATDKLPATGLALRRTFRSVAADLGINEVHVHLLTGHSLTGVNQGYILKLALTGGPGLRAAQAAILAGLSRC